MVHLTTRERVDTFWSKTLATDVSDLRSPGIRVRPNPPSRAYWRGVYVLVLDGGATVYCPDDLLRIIEPAVADQDTDSLLEPKTWHTILGEQVKNAWGPVLHYYLDSREGLDAYSAGRRLNPRDAAALADLRGSVSYVEWLSTGFTAQTAMLFGIFDGERLMAAANLTPGPDAATDVGFVLRPEARGRGYGLQIAACAARQAILMHGVARYRALTSSPSTMAIADRLGFEQYGRNLAAYLKADTFVPMA